MTNPLTGRRILVVEDEMIVAWNLEDMLAELGCVVVGAPDRIALALTMIDAQAIDVALLDVNLGGRASYPVADALAAHGLPFAFSTGYGKDSLAAGYRNVPVLPKPCHPAELRKMLEKLVSARSTEEGRNPPGSHLLARSRARPALTGGKP